MTLVLELTGKREVALKARAAAHGISAEQYLQRMVDHELVDRETEPASSNGAHRHISEIIGDRMRKMPDEAWDWVPADALDQIDHYVYGTPKRNV